MSAQRYSYHADGDRIVLEFGDDSACCGLGRIYSRASAETLVAELNAAAEMAEALKEALPFVGPTSARSRITRALRLYGAKP